MMTIDSDKKNN